MWVEWEKTVSASLFKST